MNNKKNILFSIIIIICLFFTSCSCKKYIPKIIKNTKPSNHYYYDQMINNLTLSKDFKIYVLDTNYYQKLDFNESDILTFKNFIKNINKEDFINKPTDLPSTPPYKVFIEFKQDKFVINVYNENYISIFPWDGNFSMDFISTQKIFKAYNLYGLCRYLIPPDEL